MIYTYTCVINGFDNLRPPLVDPDPGVRYICFTNLPFQPECQPWEFRPVHYCGGPSRTSRLPKIVPHLLLPDDMEYSIWHDANFQILQSPRKIIELLKIHDWAAYAHPGRDCVYAEADILLREKIGDPGLVREEIAAVRAAGHPAHAGLWANGFIVRRNSAIVRESCVEWWKRFSRSAGRDQLSFPVVARDTGIGIETICGGGIYGSPYAKFSFHAPWGHRDDNPSFRPERERLAQRIAELEELAGHGGYEVRVY